MLALGLFVTAGLAAFGLVLPVSAVYGGFVKTSGRDFVLDGCKRYFSATNIYYLTTAVSELNRPRFDNGMNAAAAHGLEVIRIWGFCESCTNSFISFSNGAMVVNSTNLEALDYVVAGASQRNIRVVITLTNNWADYGGMDVYTKNLGGTYHDDFYSNTKIKAAFKQYISAIVNRINHETGIAYKDDPAIFAWQLANEPRCGGASNNLARSPNCSPPTITAWADEMSTYIKSLDSNHLVSVGDEGMGLPASAGTPGNDYVYRYSEGTNFTDLVSLKNVDYGTFHFYPIGWGLTNIPLEGNQWITAHANIGKALNKPVVLEEFGLEEKSLQKLNYDAWYQQSITDHISMVMFWMAAGSDYPNFSNYQLYDSDMTTLIDPWTVKIVAQNQCCFTSALKTVNLTITDTTVYSLPGCGAVWSTCTTGCCNHGLSCIDFGTGYKQCQPRFPTYRTATTGLPVVITPDPCKGGPTTTMTSALSSPRATTTTSSVTSSSSSRSTTTSIVPSITTRATTTTTTSRATSVSSSSPLPTATSCSVKWAQCGGINWTGPKCCVSGSTCTYSNDYYSQCL
ncbi:glycoside hydrolase superfamily [Cladochytrium replicatum]|nr:glycoside hydrolase superfamily [Cladochytrium replicatum]